MKPEQATYRGLLAGYAVGVGFLLTGCTPPAPQNTPPVASAGLDQNVKGADAVALDGSASTDADGDVLSFLWEQTAGTAITLNNFGTPKPTFTAPNVSETLKFKLTVDDGHGGTASATVNVTVTALQPILFVADGKGANVLTFKNLVGATGNVAPDNNLLGLQTKLSLPFDVAVNAAGQLLVCNIGNDSITVYNDALNTNGNVAPVRTVKGAATGLSFPSSLSIDRARDVAYVLNGGAGATAILAFAGTSTAAFDGNVAPSRKITSNSLVDPSGSFLDDADNLYVADFSAGSIQVFANASTLNGKFAPARTLSGPAFAHVVHVFVDRNDNLFAVINNGLISVVKFGSLQNGLTTPNNSLFVQGSVHVGGIAVDASDTGYITDTDKLAMYLVNNISTRNETVTADGTIEGGNTQLFKPGKMFLLEQ